MSTIAVIDLESTCWKTGEKPEDEISEIIEIGFQIIDMADLRLLHGGGILVRPEHSTVSEFCTELTGHTQENLDKRGVSALAAFTTMRGLGMHKMPWASWGNYDRNMIDSSVRAHDMQRRLGDPEMLRPVSAKHLNVKTLYAWGANLEREVGMDVALRQLGMKLEGRHHNGADDAKNIARILCVLLRRQRQ